MSGKDSKEMNIEEDVVFAHHALQGFYRSRGTMVY
jgi:hypothetical protein